MDNYTEIEEINDDELLQEHSSETEIENGGNDDNDDILHSHQSKDNVSSLVEELQEKIHRQNGANNYEVSFGSSIYTDAEIDKMEHDVDMAKSEVAARKSDVSNWESKVSLNNTEEHKKNGDYANAVSHLSDAKSRYNTAVEKLNAAKEKLNNAR